MDKKEFAKHCRQVVAEGCVLLENDGTLPFSKQDKVAVFGREQFEYVKSGTGSGGSVNCEYVTDINSSIKKRMNIDGIVEDYYKKFLEENAYDTAGKKEVRLPVQKQPNIDEEFVKAAASRNEKALIVISRIFGEGVDMTNVKGGYLLTDEEENAFALISKHFKKVAVVVNSGNAIDLSWISKYKIGSVMLVWQGGQEGGEAVASVLTGESYPSGRLPLSIAPVEAYKNVPFGDVSRNIHTEDIYVGYRYLLTFCPEKVIYPFGYGLDYTSFNIETKSCKFCDGEAVITVDVTNNGNFKGKEVVQVYYSAPQGKLGKPARELVAYKKTKELSPKETQTIVLKFAVSEMASFDDKNACGFGRAFVTENGSYDIFVGKDCENIEKIGVYENKTDVCVKKTGDAMHPRQSFMRFTPLGKEKVEGYDNVYAEEDLKEIAYTGDKNYSLKDVVCGVCSMDDFIAQFTLKELSYLVKGEGWGSEKASVKGSAAVMGGTTEAMLKHGVPVVTLCDGPSGPRTTGDEKYTCIPSGIIIASTWNTECIKEVFKGFAEELKESKIDVILAPGVNIHRHPFCGRNFEYFSEDPLIAGDFAAAITECFTDNGILATVKHFAVNSQENGRRGEDEILSERALREIYLKVFEKAVKTKKLNCIMTSYNRINGISACANVGLTDVILRREWGYDGLVMSDWWARADKFSDGTISSANVAEMVKAQNDIYMVAENVVEFDDDVLLELENGGLTLAELQRAARHILECVTKTLAFKNM